MCFSRVLIVMAVLKKSSHRGVESQMDDELARLATVRELDVKSKALDMRRQKEQFKKPLSQVTEAEKNRVVAEWEAAEKEERMGGGRQSRDYLVRMQKEYNLPYMGPSWNHLIYFKEHAAVTEHQMEGNAYAKKVAAMEKASKELVTRLAPLNHTFTSTEEYALSTHLFMSPVQSFHDTSESSRKTIEKAKKRAKTVSEKTGYSEHRINQFLQRWEARFFLADSLNSLPSTKYKVTPTDVSEARFDVPDKKVKNWVKNDYAAVAEESGMPVMFPGTIIVPDFQWDPNAQRDGATGYSRNLRDKLGNEDWVGGFCSGGNFQKNNPFSVLGLQISAESVKAQLHEDVHQADIYRHKRRGAHIAITELLAYRADIHKEAAGMKEGGDALIMMRWDAVSRILKQDYLPRYGETEMDKKEQETTLDTAITQIQRMDKILGKAPTTHILLNAIKLDDITKYGESSDRLLGRLAKGYSKSNTEHLLMEFKDRLNEPDEQTKEHLWNDLEQREQDMWRNRSRMYLVGLDNRRQATIFDENDGRAKQNMADHFQRWHLAQKRDGKELWDILPEKEKKHWLSKSYLDLPGVNGKPGLKALNPSEGYAISKAKKHYMDMGYVIERENPMKAKKAA